MVRKEDQGSIGFNVEIDLLDITLQAKQEAEGAFLYLKDLIEGLATYSSLTFKEAACWLADELNSASPYERPTWYSINDNYSPYRKSRAPDDEGMTHLKELSDDGGKFPAMTYPIGFDFAEIRPFVFRRLERMNRTESNLEKARTASSTNVDESPITTGERKTLRKLWLFLAKHYGFNADAQRNNATGKLKQAMEKHGISMDDGTIRENMRVALEDDEGHSQAGAD